MIIHLINGLGAFSQSVPGKLWQIIQEWWPLLVAVAVVVGIGRLWLAWVYRAREASRARWVQINPPAAIGPEAGQRFARSLAGILHRKRRHPMRARHVACEFAATDSETRIGIWVPPGLSVTSIAEAVEHAWPGAHTTTKTAPILPGQTNVSSREIVPRAGAWAPIVDSSSRTSNARTSADTADPLGHVLAMLATRSPDEQAIAQVIISANRRKNNKRLLLRVLNIVSSALLWVVREILDILQPGSLSRPTPPYRHNVSGATVDDPVAQARMRAEIAKKTAGQHLHVTVRVTVTNPASRNENRRDQVNQIANGYDTVATTGDGLITRRTWWARHRTTNRRPGTGFITTLSEFAAFWHLPVHGGMYAIDTHPARQRSPRRDLPTFEHRPFEKGTNL